MNQENMPLVTAVIPVYNHEKYVVESIRSILNQTYPNIELIILNDGSKDRSHEMILPLVEECQRRFVRFEYISRENVGLSATLNQALAWARGVYCTGIASDDVAMPEKTELLVNALEEKGPEYAAAFGNAWFIDDAGRKIRLDQHGSVSDGNGACDNFLDFYTQGRALDYRGEEFGTYASLISGNYLPAGSYVMRTAAMSDAGGWTPGNVVEDWEMWLKLSKKYKFAFVDRGVAAYRWHPLNTIKLPTSQMKCAMLRLVMAEKAFSFEHGCASRWRATRNSLAGELLKHPDLSIREKLAILKAWEKDSLMRYAVERFKLRLH